MTDRAELIETLENVLEFLNEIRDPGSVALAEAIDILDGRNVPATAARLLTLGEVREWKEFLWIESRNPARQLVQGIFFKWEDGSMVFLTRDDLWIHKFSAIYYGMHARCWATRPSVEQMDATAWEDGDDA